MRRGKWKAIGWVVTIFYVLGIISAVQAIMTVRTPQGALAWSLSLVTVPVIAVPAYWVLGRSKFEGTRAAYEQRKTEIDELLRTARQNLKPYEADENSAPAELDALERLGTGDFTMHNRLELLINGDRTFESILAGIAQAREYVIVQFYMFHDDSLGQRMQQAMIERARAGVRVYMLYDEVGSGGLPKAYVGALREAGVQVSSFKPTQGWRNRFQLNFRNHRKIVVVDGVTGWVGGHNVGDEYLGLDPEFSPWRDTHVRIDGPAVIQLQAVALGDWYWATREIPSLNWVPRAADDAEAVALIVGTAPSQRLETAGLMFVNALNSARERVWLSAPYFVPDEAVIKALELAALRGVDVRILLTGKGDSQLVFLAAYNYIEQLQGLGIRFFEYRPGFLHEKVMLVDDQVSTVGTANFDNRSFRLNFEVTAVIVNGPFAQQMERMFEADFEHSDELDPATLAERPFWWRFAVKATRLAAPVL